VDSIDSIKNMNENLSNQIQIFKSVFKDREVVFAVRWIMARVWFEEILRLTQNKKASQFPERLFK
jgi:hypothetical protein